MYRRKVCVVPWAPTQGAASQAFDTCALQPYLPPLGSRVALGQAQVPARNRAHQHSRTDLKWSSQGVAHLTTRQESAARARTGGSGPRVVDGVHGRGAP